MSPPPLDEDEEVEEVDWQRVERTVRDGVERARSVRADLIAVLDEYIFGKEQLQGKEELSQPWPTFKGRRRDRRDSYVMSL